MLRVIYEDEFLGFSYGFRPKRSQHDALDALMVGIVSRKVNFILDADIRSFFTEVSQEWVVRFLEHRIGDTRIVRLVQKWLRAGILEDGIVTVEEHGTGQGSVISPLLANIYLHFVFDLWAERWRRREATGDMIMVRYADDIVAGFQHESDARRFWDAMRDRLREFSLSLHPDKTRLIEFGRVRARRASKPNKYIVGVLACGSWRRCARFRVGTPWPSICFGRLCKAVGLTCTIKRPPQPAASEHAVGRCDHGRHQVSNPSEDRSMMRCRYARGGIN